MAAISTPCPVKLVVGMLSARRELLSAAAERLGRDCGPIDLTGEVLDFDYTDHYHAQMGRPLLRQFVAFERLIDPAELGRIKLVTNAIEAEFAAGAAPAGPPRPVNLDPGYVGPAKLVLASAKDFAHRVYLGGGIYAEVTLTYVRGRWVAAEHTFPDYACGAYDEFLTSVRQRLRDALRRKADQP